MIPETLCTAVEAYESALVSNDVQRLSAFFANDPSGIPVVRVDNAGPLWGHDAIAAFRATRKPVPPRSLHRRTYRMLGSDAAVVVAEFDRSTGGRVTQSQVWQLADGAWRIVSAHLTYPMQALDSRTWRIVGTPLVRGRHSETDPAPLQGQTVAVKDLYGVAGYVIGAGSMEYLKEGEPSKRHSWPVQRLLDAGADITGISRTDEFAYSLAGTNAHYGTSPNAKAPGHIPGGSSSGSATAVASGQVSIGLGSDTGGSVRVPSAYQGLWGIRTTHGRIPMDGVLPLAQSFDTVGWMTRDAALLEQVCAAMCPDTDEPDAPLSGKVHWVPELVANAHPDVAAALRSFLNHVDGLSPLPLDSLLGTRMPSDGNDRLADWLTTFKTVQGFEAWHNHGDWIREHPGTLGADVAARFTAASRLTEADYATGLEQLRWRREHLRAALGGDIVLIPSASGVAPLIGEATIGGPDIERERTATLRMTCIAGLGGLPAVNIPLQTSTGLPCGICAVGPAGSDRALIHVTAELAAAATQRAAPTAHRLTRISQ